MYENKTKRSLKTTSQTGNAGGLLLELFARPNESPNSLSKISGINVLIYNNTLKNEMPIYIPTGTSAVINLEKSVANQLPSPYSSCVENIDSIDGHDSYLFKFLISENHTYSQEVCYLMHIQSEIIKKCVCYYVVFHNMNDSRPCTDEKDNICVFEVIQSLVEQGYRKKIENLCPKECLSIKHNYQIFYSKFPTENYVIFSLE